MEKTNFSKPLLIGLVLLAIFLNILVFYTFVIDQPSLSEDYQIYKTAVQIHQNGEDPYDMSMMYEYRGRMLPFRYPPITLPFFSLITKFHHFIIYSILLIIIFLISWKTDKKFKPFLFMALLLTAFMAAFKNFSIGNIGLVEMIFLSLTFYFMSKEKYRWSAVMIGIMAIFKTIPLVFCVGFIFLPIENWKKIWCIIISIWTFILLHLISFFMYPSLSMSFYKTLLIKYPIIDAVGYYNPSSLSMFAGMFKGIWLFITYGIFIIIIGLFFLWIYKKKKLNFISVYSFFILATMLVLPELKHYTYVLAITPLYFLVKDLRASQVALAFFIVSIVPLIFMFSAYIFEWFRESPLLYFYYYAPYFSLFVISEYLMVTSSPH